MNPLLHPVTAQHIDDFLRQPSHALLVAGPQGSGKSHTAQYIASQLLNSAWDKVSDHPYVRWLQSDDKAISIEEIRGAQSFMQLKVPGKSAIRRILIIEDGERMSQEAQNAFLKLLEEPPADSVILVTVSGIDHVLPTIRSRSQILQILPPSKESALEYFKSEGTTASLTKAYYLSEGYPGLMKALLNPDIEHPLIDQISTAKEVLSSPVYQRLCKVDELVKRKNIPLLLMAMERVCHAALTQAINQNHINSRLWTNRLKAVVEAQQQADTHVSSKLLLTNLMLAL